ncbi:MAG: riboflavin kinase [Bacteroidales bacterium]|jgi:riboflavin kinase/FMN adenylyltransferase|nr:riboflavin kinase [Bacteroidales bacterium]
MEKDLYTGTIVHGQQQGRQWGFPTANVCLLPPQTWHHPTGVYAVRLQLTGKKYHGNYTGMLYAGTRPTLHLKQLSIEIHIFNFVGNIYEEKILFIPCLKIREEHTFDSVTRLIDQIREDEKKIREYFDTQLIIDKW